MIYGQENDVMVISYDMHGLNQELSFCSQLRHLTHALSEPHNLSYTLNPCNQYTII